MIVYPLGGGVYQIRNKLINSAYIGKAVNFKNRWHGHIGDLKLNRHLSYPLQRDYNIIGIDNLAFEVLEYIEQDCNGNMIDAEKYWINKKRADGVFLYNNMRRGGGFADRRKQNVGILFPVTEAMKKWLGVSK